MSRRLALYGMLWRGALSHLHPYAHRIILFLGAGVAVASVLVGFFGLGPSSAYAFGWTTPFACGLLVWTGFYLPGAFKLNTPGNAQLTPGMRARLVELSFLAWLVCIAGLVIGLAGQSPRITLPALWLILFSLAMGLANAGNRAGSALVIAIWPVMLVRPLAARLPDWVVASIDHPAFFPLASALLVAPGLMAIRAMFPQAGDDHWRMLGRRSAWSGSGQSMRPAGKGVFLWLQSRALRRATEGRKLRSLLLHGGGPGLQLGLIAPGMVLAGVLGLVLLGLAHLSGKSSVVAAAAEIGWIWGLLPLLVFQVYMLMLITLEQSRAGQGLLRLAPVMPASAAHFNDLLASGLVRAGLASWACASLTGLGFAWMSGSGATELGWLATLCCLALPALAVPLRDHARRLRWNAVLQWLLVLIVAGACMLAGQLAQRIVQLPMLPIAAACAVAFTAAMVTRGRSSMLRSPVAFPAGRLD